MRLTICIPVYNEADNIRSALERIREKVRGEYAVAILYDSEDDTTLPALDRAEQELGITVRRIRNKYGRGVLNAIRTGFETVDSEYVVVTMADLCDPPEVINAMLETADREHADIVCASRYMAGGSQQGGPLLKGMMSRFAGVLLYHIAGLPTHDPTNSFKLYRKSFLEKMTVESSGGFEIGLELVVKAFTQGYRVSEVPTAWTDRTAGKSNFKLMKWLPHYLHWFFLPFQPENLRKRLSGFFPVIRGLLFLILVLTHFNPVNTVSFGLDPSWRLALNWAFLTDRQYGQDIIFTYGPLGWLFNNHLPTYQPWLLLLIFFFLLNVTGKTFFRERSGRPLILLFLFVFFAQFVGILELTACILPFTIYDLYRSRKKWTVFQSLHFSGCILTAVMLSLIKFMFFPLMVFVLLLLDVYRVYRRRFPPGLLLFLIFFVLTWFFCNQKIENIPSFLRYSYYISSGYNQTMSHGTFLFYHVISYGIAAVVLLLFTCRQPLRTRPVFAILVLLISFLVFKHVFLRYDPYHFDMLLGFGILPLYLLVSNPFHKGKSNRFLNGAVAFSLLVIYLTTPMPFHTVKGRCNLAYSGFATLEYEMPLYKILRPFQEIIPIIVNPENGRAVKKKFLPAAENLPTLDIYRSECSLPIFDKRFRYQPRPIFQSYSSYTPELLEFNRRKLVESPPDFLIWQMEEVIDNRLATLADAPSWPFILANYVPVSVYGQGYLLLKKRNVPASSLPLKEIGTQVISQTDRFFLPSFSDGKLLWASFEFEYSALGKLLLFFYRLPEINMNLTVPTTQITKRIIPQMMKSPILLSPFIQTENEFAALYKKETYAALPKLSAVQFSFSGQSLCALFYMPAIKIRFYESPAPYMVHLDFQEKSRLF